MSFPFVKQMCLFVVCLHTLVSFAQSPITLTRADFPKPSSTSVLPDSVLFTTVTGQTTNAQLSAGANQVWDESSLTGTASYQPIIDMSATPLIFQLLFFGSDYAQPLLNGNGLLTGGIVSDAFEYYNYAANDTRLEVRGFGASIAFNGSIATPIPALYSSPDVLYRFPISFGNVDSSESGYNITLPIDSSFSIGFKRKQKRINEVDAWGRITTPAGSFDVLRQTSTIQRVDSLVTPFGTIGFPSNPIEYKWLGQGKQIPVLQINATRNGNSINVTNATFWGEESAPASVNAFQTDSKLRIFPNPAEQFINVSWEKPNHPVTIQFFSLQGAYQAQFHFKASPNSTFQENLPVSGFRPGIYLIRVLCGPESYTQQWVKK